MMDPQLLPGESAAIEKAKSKARRVTAFGLGFHREAGLSYEQALRSDNAIKAAIPILRDYYIAQGREAGYRAGVMYAAAECHRKKWAHENSPARFDVLHRMGNKLLGDVARGEQS